MNGSDIARWRRELGLDAPTVQRSAPVLGLDRQLEAMSWVERALVSSWRQRGLDLTDAMIYASVGRYPQERDEAGLAHLARLAEDPRSRAARNLCEHEASHAVTGHVLGARVLLVTVERHRNPGGGVNEGATLTDTSALSDVEEAAYYLAAEAWLTVVGTRDGITSATGCGADRSEATKLVDDAGLRSAWSLAIAVLRDSSSYVRAVADRLERDRTIDLSGQHGRSAR